MDLSYAVFSSTSQTYVTNGLPDISTRKFNRLFKHNMSKTELLIFYPILLFLLRGKNTIPAVAQTKNWSSLLHVSFLSQTLPIHQENLLALPSNFILNQTTQ